MTTGERIKSLRLAANLSRAECARQVPMPLRTLEEWESGRHRPTEVRWLIGLARVLGVTLAMLLDEKEVDA